MSHAYYNEIDPESAQWLRNLIAEGHIAPGEVDTRSIEDVRPSEIRGFTQCHFFAGIGVWSYSLRRAGWTDERPVWTGSCPCQPFIAAGKGAAFADERHLWPAFHHLIKECNPAIVLGEQVASKDADPWIDLVQDDMEAMGYAFGAIPFPSASVGAPHIRDRLYWVANSDDARLERRIGVRQRAPQRSIGACGMASGMANAERQQCEDRIPRPGQGDRTQGSGQTVEFAGFCSDGWPGPTNSYWRDADWLFCRDGRWRPVEPGTFPLAHGAPARMGSLPPRLSGLADLAGLDAQSLKRAKSHRVAGLRGYGNAINAQAAQAWIECVMECMP